MEKFAGPATWAWLGFWHGNAVWSHSRSYAQQNRKAYADLAQEKQIGGFGESIVGSRKRAFKLSMRETVELKKEPPGSSV